MRENFKMLAASAQVNEIFYSRKILHTVLPMAVIPLALLLSGCGTSVNGTNLNATDSDNKRAESGEKNDSNVTAPTAEENFEVESKLTELEEQSFSLGGDKCQQKNLDVCLAYKGGQACYARYGCKETSKLSNDSGSDPADNATFGNWYRDNYSKVVSTTKQFHTGAFGCAATATTALKLFGHSIVQKKVTNDLETQLIKKGWTVINDMKKLKKGDVVFTDKATSNIPGTYSHVYVFQHYEGEGFARITDNNGNLILRNVGPGPRSKSIKAYRK